MADELKQLEVGCGKCCMHIGKPPFLPKPEEQGGRVVNGLNIDFADEEGDVPEHLVEEWRQYHYDIRDRKTVNRTALEMPCYWLDLDAMLCKHYEHRPRV